MKKHRNFLFFYSLWLAGIMVVFLAFGEEGQIENLKADSEVCTVAKDLKHSSTKAFNKKKCDLKDL